MIFNKLNNNCIPVCLNGTISTIDPRTCSCPFPALLIFKVGMGCICHNYQDNYYYDPRSQKCLLSPCLNGTMINGICACPSTTLRFDSLYGCVCIIPYALYNPETNLCVANCLNATADGNGNCICSPKAILMFKFSIGCVCI